MGVALALGWRVWPRFPAAPREGPVWGEAACACFAVTRSTPEASMPENAASTTRAATAVTRMFRRLPRAGRASGPRNIAANLSRGRGKPMVRRAAAGAGVVCAG